MKNILLKLVLSIFLLIIINGCEKEKTTTTKNFNTLENNRVSEKSIFSLGESVLTDYFEVTVNSASSYQNINLGKSSLTNLPAQEGIQYIVIDTTFKNISRESRMIDGGSILVQINGKIYNFDKSETILANGWGLFLDQINPLMSKRTKLVYKLPLESFEKIYYVPGRNNKQLKVDLATSPVKESQKKVTEPSLIVKNNNPNQQYRLKEKISTELFDITLNNILFSNSVDTGNRYTNIQGDENSSFLIMDLTFKNTSQESRYIPDGEVIINFNGIEYTFDKPEIIMLDGWGVLLEQINPFISKRTKLVYKIPNKEPSYITYIPGRNKEKKGFLIYDKTESDQKKALEIEEENKIKQKEIEAQKKEQLKIEEENKRKIEEQKMIITNKKQNEITNQFKENNNSKLKENKPTKPKKLVYSEDSVYTHLTWKGYRTPDALERFKADHGLPPNKVIDEKVLKALGMEIKYK